MRPIGEPTARTDRHDRSFAALVRRAVAGLLLAGGIVVLWSAAAQAAPADAGDGSIGSALTDLTSSVEPTVGGITEPVVDNLPPLVQPIVDTVAGDPDAGNPADTAGAADPVGRVLETAAPVIETVQPVVDTVQPVVETVQPLVETVADQARPVTERVQPIVDTVQPIVDTVQPIVDTVRPVVDPVVGIVDEATGGLTDVVPVPHTPPTSPSAPSAPAPHPTAHLPAGSAPTGSEHPPTTDAAPSTDVDLRTEVIGRWTPTAVAPLPSIAVEPAGHIPAGAAAPAARASATEAEPRPAPVPSGSEQPASPSPTTDGARPMSDCGRTADGSRSGGALASLGPEDLAILADHGRRAADGARVDLRSLAAERPEVAPD